MAWLRLAHAATLMTAAFAVPLTQEDGWQVLDYRGIPPHLVHFTSEGLKIDVRRSASPVIYPLAAPLRVSGVRVRGRIVGTLNVAGARQGTRGHDDYALRVGLVEAGERRLGFFERRFAAPWVRTLFDLAPRGTGIARVRFLNLAVDDATIGARRQHPLSELLHEEVVAAPSADGRFAFERPLDPPAPVLAVWISADGDDTGSTFTVTIESLVLEEAPDARS